METENIKKCLKILFCLLDADKIKTEKVKDDYLWMHEYLRDVEYPNP